MRIASFSVPRLCTTLIPAIVSWSCAFTSANVSRMRRKGLVAYRCHTSSEASITGTTESDIAASIGLIANMTAAMAASRNRSITALTKIGSVVRSCSTSFCTRDMTAPAGVRSK